MMKRLMASPSFERLEFEHKVNQVLQTIERILDVERRPLLAGSIEHTYGAKYSLVNRLTNALIIAYMNVFEKMGLDGNILKLIDKKAATTIRFEASTQCIFLKEVVVDVPMDRTYVEEVNTKSTGILGKTKTERVSKVVHHIKEFHYMLEVTWSIILYSGSLTPEKLHADESMGPTSDLQNVTTLKYRTSSETLITQSKDHPPEVRKNVLHDLSLTWLLQQIDTVNLTTQFMINIEDDETKTPRRNKAIEKAIKFCEQFSIWCNDVQTFFNHLVGVFKKHNPAISTPSHHLNLNYWYDLPTDKVFNPILPVMEDITEVSTEANDDTVERNAANKCTVQLLPFENEDENDAKTVLSRQDLSKLLNEHFNTLDAALLKITQSYQVDTNFIISHPELSLGLLLHHVQKDLRSNYLDSMSYVESMIETQLVAAIGKRLTTDDLEKFVKFHFERFLALTPQPFAYVIRRPEHNPVGLLSIESTNSISHACIQSHSRTVNAGSSLHIPLNAATCIELTGEQFFHGWMQHRFANDCKSYNLVARARQFSSFILVIGNMTGPSSLEPKDAIIIQNKDELLIPLILEELPTAKEFKDAVKSLSPEQQRFAKSYRTMQLASTVFGVCVIQVKPQLESLLGLPPDALDKEMKLTQDLMELFVEYQVPSDLLSYNGFLETVSIEDKLSNVKEHVKAVRDVIDAEKEKQLIAAKLKTDMAVEKAVQEGLGRFESDMPSYGHEPLKKNKYKVQRSAMSLSRSRGADVFQEPFVLQSMNLEKSMMKERNDIQGSADLIEELHQELEKLNQEPPLIESEKSIFSQQPKTSAFPQSGGVDFTLIPNMIDFAVEKSGDDRALRSTILKTYDDWVRNRQESLLSDSIREHLNADTIKTEKNKAFDLLDALSRSGSLQIKYSELHVVVAVTHCFERNIMDTVICENINPIEKMEMSTLLFASIIHGIPAKELIKDATALNRLSQSMPLLLQPESN